MPVAPPSRIPPLGFRVWEVPGRLAMAQPHSHVDLEINFVAAGHVRYQHGGASARIRAGEVGVFWGGVPHQLVAASPSVRGVWMTVPVEWLLRWNLPGGVTARLLGGGFLAWRPPTPPFSRWEADFASGEPALLRAVTLEVEALLQRAAFAHSTVAAADTTGPAAGRRVERVTDFLARRYAEPLDLPTIAAAASVHPKYLARIFRAQCGLTVWEYLTRLRIAHAQRLLLTTDLRIIDVALESGFASVAAFYAAFAQYGEGGKPAAFRRKRSRAAG